MPAQTFAMGDSSGDGRRGDGESPAHAVTVAAFEVDATTVTNAASPVSSTDTGHVTEAESFVLRRRLRPRLAAAREAVMGPATGAPWWVG